MGKTSLATNIAFNVATANLRDPSQPRQPVAFFSLEMSAEQLATRILAERTNISSEKLRRGQLNDDDFGLLVQASQDLEDRQSVVEGKLRSVRVDIGGSSNFKQ